MHLNGTDSTNEAWEPSKTLPDTISPQDYDAKRKYRQHTLLRKAQFISLKGAQSLRHHMGVYTTITFLCFIQVY